MRFVVSGTALLRVAEKLEVSVPEEAELQQALSVVRWEARARGVLALLAAIRARREA